jgi:hypothetical protein
LGELLSGPFLGMRFSFKYGMELLPMALKNKLPHPNKPAPESQLYSVTSQKEKKKRNYCTHYY